MRRWSGVSLKRIRPTSVVLGELIYGVFHGPSSYQAWNLELLAQIRQQFDSIAFDDRAAEEYGSLRADLAIQRKIIGPNDLTIAALALANGLTLVTHNTAECRGIPGLNLEDGQAA